MTEAVIESKGGGDSWVSSLPRADIPTPAFCAEAVRPSFLQSSNHMTFLHQFSHKMNVWDLYFEITAIIIPPSFKVTYVLPAGFQVILVQLLRKTFSSLCSTLELICLGNKPIDIAPKQPFARDGNNFLTLLEL